MDTKTVAQDKNAINSKDNKNLQNGKISQSKALNMAFSELLETYAPADLYKALSNAIKDVITSEAYQDNQAHSVPTDLIMLMDLKESLLSCTVLLSPTAKEDILSISNDYF